MSKPLAEQFRELRRTTCIDVPWDDDSDCAKQVNFLLGNADEIERALEWWEKNEADDSLLFRAVKRIERLTQIIGDGQLDRIAALEEQLRLANIDAANNETEANALREHLAANADGLQHDSNCVFQPGPGKWFCATRCNVQGSRKAREVLDGHLQERQDDH